MTCPHFLSLDASGHYKSSHPALVNSKPCGSVRIFSRKQSHTTRAAPRSTPSILRSYTACPKEGQRALGHGGKSRTRRSRRKKRSAKLVPLESTPGFPVDTENLLHPEPAQDGERNACLLTSSHSSSSQERWSLRFCIDYRRLNTKTVADAYQLPRMDDCLDSLGDAAIFTTLD